MKFFTLLLCVAFVAGIAADSGKNVNEQHMQTSAASMPVVKPTEAPLVTSTVSPTRAPTKANPTPTKPTAITVNANASNATKKTAHKVATTNEKQMEMKPTEISPIVSEKEMKLEAVPVAMPATVESEMKPLAVTGFITKNGNIYEIEDNKGTGKIKRRQIEENKDHICNYGAVVVYSDVPCDEVTNIKVGGVEEKPALDTKPEKPTETAVESKPEQDKDQATEDEEDLDAVRPVKRSRPNNKRRNKNKRQKVKLQQQKKNKNRPNKNGLKRPNNNRRRVQQQQRPNQQKRRRQQMKRQQQNRRQKQNAQRRRNQKRRQQAQRMPELEDEELQYNRGRRN